MKSYPNAATSEHRYSELRKPSWAPPSRLFGPVWTVLYLIIIVTFGKVFALYASGAVSTLVALPFALNLVFNLAFTPIQFGLKNDLLASIDIALVLATLVWALVVVHPILPYLAYWNVPYLLWVAFATVLQFTITAMNRRA